MALADAPERIKEFSRKRKKSYERNNELLMEAAKDFNQRERDFELSKFPYVVWSDKKTFAFQPILPNGFKCEYIGFNLENRIRKE